MARPADLHREWSAAASELHLECSTSLLRLRIEGEHEGLQVQVWTLVRSGRAHTAVEVRSIAGLMLERFGPPGRSLWGRKLERGLVTGDVAFDSTVEVHGERRLAFAALTAETRKLIRRGVRKGVSLHKGPLTLTLPRILSKHAVLVRVVGSLTSLARQLLPGQPVDEMLAQNAINDPVALVRLRNLELLVPDAAPELVLETCQVAQRDRHAAVRLLAASRSESAGHETLRRLATNTRIGQSLRAEAIRSLGEHLPTGAALGVMTRAVEHGHFEVARAAVQSLRTRDLDRRTLRALAEMLKRTIDASLPAVLVVNLLEVAARSGHSQFEGHAISALTHWRPEVRVAAARALAATGTATAVTRLLKVERDANADRELRRLSRMAILAIQERLDGAAAGQVMLAEQPQGHISLAEETDRGGLAIAPASMQRRPRR